MQAAHGELLLRGLGGGGQLTLFPVVRLAALDQPRAAGTHRIDLGPVRQDEEQTAFYPGPGVQTAVHSIHPRGTE